MANIPRRSVVNGIAWSTPAVVVATSAPSFASSAITEPCINRTANFARFPMTSDGGPRPRFVNGGVLPLRVSTGTIYAQLTYSQSNCTPDGVDHLNNTYRSEDNGIVLYQEGASSCTPNTATVEFFRDPELVSPALVHDATIFITYVSSYTTRECSGWYLDTCSLVTTESYEDGLSVAGLDISGSPSIAPRTQFWEAFYNPTKRPWTRLGDGSIGNPWYIPAKEVWERGFDEDGVNTIDYGGYTLRATFDRQPVSGVVFQQYSNLSDWAKGGDGNPSGRALSGGVSTTIGSIEFCA